jgi:beta-glucosidase
VNYYHDDCVSGHPVEHRGVSPTGLNYASPFIGSEYVSFPPRDLPHTAMGWEVNADGLRTLLMRLTLQYPTLPALYVTENGAAYEDVVSADGRVHDPDRTRFISEHIDAVAEAIAEGADVRGYFLWSLLDNFEWAWGFDKRFGIVHVDYQTQVRTIKDSGLAYAAIIAGALSPAS